MLTSMLNQFEEIVMNSTCFDARLGSSAHAEPHPMIHHWVGIARGLLEHLKISHQRSLTESQLTALDGLSAETLKDIGAPDWMQERARPGRWSALDPAYWR